MRARTSGSCGFSLAMNFEKDDARGDRSIQRSRCGATHGDTGDEIAAFAHEATESVALGADNEAPGAGEVEIAERPVTLRVQSGDPQTCTSGLVDGSTQITDAANRDAIHRTGRSLGDRRCQTHPTPPWQHGGIHTQRVGRAQNCAQVVRVLKVVEKQQERGGSGSSQDFVVVRVVAGCQQRDRSLMIAATGRSIQGGSIQQVEGDAAVPGATHDVIHHVAMATTNQQQPTDRPSLFEDRKHGSTSVDDLFFSAVFAHWALRMGKGWWKWEQGACFAAPTRTGYLMV